MNKWKYYAVAGFNGYGVYDDYQLVLKSKKYIHGFRVKAFIDQGAALRYAQRLYYDLQIQKYNVYHPVFTKYMYNKLNWFFHCNVEFISPFVILP